MAFTCTFFTKQLQKLVQGGFVIGPKTFTRLGELTDFHVVRSPGWSVEARLTHLKSVLVWSMAQQQPPGRRAIPRVTLDSLLAGAESELAAINAYNGPLLDLLEDEPIAGDLWATFVADNKIKTLTNLSQESVTNLYQCMLPFIAEAAKRGTKPKSSWMDHLLCYLIWGKLAADVDTLACLLAIKPSRLEENISRIRPIVCATLRSEWWEHRSRPSIQADSPFPNVALLIDAHTSSCFRPKGPFEQSKRYWDKKNHCYGVKSEVGVMAAPPHYCLFVGAHTEGSVHDYHTLKHHYTKYLDYLLKQPNENRDLHGDAAHRFWAVMADKAYIGPPEDTPDLRRIVPKRGARSVADLEQNRRIALHRVPIEQFFGRVLGLWAVARVTYRWDHPHFDADFTNWCLLTNEHIKVCPLPFAACVPLRGCYFSAF